MGMLFIIGACLLWAMDTLLRYPLINDGLSSTSLVFYEHLLLTLVLLVISSKSLGKFKQLKLKNFLSFIIIGGLGSAVATVCFSEAFRYLNPSLVILLQKFQPVIAISLASMILKEKIQSGFIWWSVVCLVGVLFVSYEDILRIVDSGRELEELLFHEGAGLGYLLTLISVVGWGAATVFGKRLSSEGFSDDLILFGRFATGLIFLIPIVFYARSPLFTEGINIYGKISLLVFVSGLLGMFLYYQGLRRVSAHIGALGEMFFPLMGVIVNWLFLGAELTAIQVLGGVLLVLGSLVIQIKRY